MNSNLITSFNYKDLLLRKISYAVASCIISQLIILLIYVFITNINVLHPFDWFSSTINTFTFISTWLFLFIFVNFIIFAQCVICAKDYVFMSVYCSTRFQQFVHIFSLHNFMLLITHVIIGGVSVWQFLSLVAGPYQYLFITCKPKKYCLVDGTFFLILNGLWTGIYYFIKIHVSSKHLKFPVIQQRKLLQFRATISPLIRESVSSALWPTIYFLLFYYIAGNQVKNGAGYSFQNDDDDNNNSSLRLYLYCWWFSSLYFFSMNLMRYFFQLFLTEAVEFPIIKDSDNVLTLQDAVNVNNLPIIQNLACLDLHLLSQWSPYRRQLFYTLSQPGGHPHNWNALVENVLKLFTEYTELLNKSLQTTPVKQNAVKPNEISEPLQAPFKFRNLRNLSEFTDELDIVDISYATVEKTENANLQVLKLALNEKFNNIVAFLKSVLGINYFFGELSQANIQKCLGNGQLIIWASQGIAELTSASIKEDQFGIVQKDIPIIITSLVQLKQSFDKLNKLPSLSKRSAINDDFNYKMKIAVCSAVKRSLFNICHTFGDYLNDLSLRKDILQYLQANIIIKND